MLSVLLGILAHFVPQSHLFVMFLLNFCFDCILHLSLSGFGLQDSKMLVLSEKATTKSFKTS